MEPDLNDLIKKVVRDKKLVASSEISEANVFIVAVPTPYIPATQTGDISMSRLQLVIFARYYVVMI